ncbi:hypothetical protein GGX14DRAFT_635580 [Mycena pura]|uniref:Uncharacterized protein n=1 Tax=Mycena pura TaxID=153505 RepID=A0AAD6VAR8_9AGAR|nr:hypothetical protein GGX14DRAFT_635580 [Mycena pura]
MKIIKHAVPLKGFPAAWLVSQDEKLVLERSEWNHEAAPAGTEDDFDVDWPRSRIDQNFHSKYPFGPLAIRLLFGVPGCIIPIAAVWGLRSDTMVFTIAGPADSEGKKDFYVYFNGYSDELDEIDLCHLPPFASVADFYQNYLKKPWSEGFIPPVAGGRDAALKELRKWGYLPLCERGR